MKTTEQILDARALGERLGLSREAIYRRRSLGQNMPPAIRIGSLLRWRSDDVDEWLEGCLESAPAGVGDPDSSRKGKQEDAHKEMRSL